MKSIRLAWWLGFLFAIVSCLLGITVHAQDTSPVPFVSLPLVPSSVPPGSGDFVLTVNGSQFVAGSVVNWNGMALATTFVSATQLTAIVPASNVAAAGTAIVTVSSPIPGGGVSNIVPFNVRTPSTSLSFAKSTINVGLSPSSVVVADFNNDGKADLAVVNQDDPDPSCPADLYNRTGTVSILLGNGDGTFSSISKLCTRNVYGSGWFAATAGDFNGDGNQDLIVIIDHAGLKAFDVFLGNGDGTFTYSGGGGGWDSMRPVVAGDFNRDGKLDLAMAVNFLGIPVIEVWTGKGDGTFAYEWGGVVCTLGAQLVVGDFNRDGILDLASNVAGCSTSSSFYTIYLGNGDGTFTPASSQPSASGMLTGDFDGDGIPDLVGEGRFTKGNGDGTFTDMGPGPDLTSVMSRVVPGVAVDLNGDSRLDVVAAGPNNNVLLYLGNGNGTFKAPISRGVGLSPRSVVAGDFNGDGLVDLAVANFGGNTVTILLQTQKIKTLLVSSPNPSLINQSVTFTATVKPTLGGGTPTGTVNFVYDTGGVLGTATLSGGSASFTTSFSIAKSYSISAVYKGDGNFPSSISASVAQKVNKFPSSTTISSNLNPSNYGQTVTFTATVASTYGSPTGTVTFKSGATILGTAALTGSTATLSTSSLNAGTSYIKAAYNGDTNFATSTSLALSQKVNKISSTTTLASSPNPSAFGQAVTFTATVSAAVGTPTGTVTFKKGTTILGTTALSGGVATFATSTLPVGSNAITARYGGATNYLASGSVTLTQVVH